MTAVADRNMYELRKKAREMYGDNVPISSICRRLKISQIRCQSFIAGLPEQIPYHLRPNYKRKAPQHDWLPEDDEANVIGYWVPRPEEIERITRAIREGRLVITTSGDVIEL